MQSEIDRKMMQAFVGWAAANDPLLIGDPETTPKEFVGLKKVISRQLQIDRLDALSGRQP